MRFATSCMLFLALLGAAPGDTTTTDRPLAIHVAPEGWGSAPPQNVEAVLRSAADALLVHLPEHGIEIIHVRGGSGPIVLYQRAEDGGYQVRLNTRDTYWAQYAFQFAHEVGHILCGYDSVQSGNHFLEETICETASLFALRQMARTWRDAPPYPNWASYARHLHQYAQDRMTSASLPEETTLAEWYTQHAEHLRENATDREKNLLIASAILPLFEADPKNAWTAVRYLNTNEPGEPQTFEQHLQRWHDETPARHQLFVRKLAAEFGVTLRKESPEEPSR